MPLTFVKSERGKNLLLHDGILYCKKRINKNDITWRCNSNENCNAIIHTDNEKRNGNIVGDVPIHHHIGNVVSVQTKIMKAKIKKKALKTNEKPGAVISNSLRGVLSPVAANLPKLISLSRTVQRIRKNNIQGDDINNNPASRADLIMKDEWKLTHNGNLFLLHDHGGDKKRLVVFSTQQNLDFLATCQQWLADGTFRTAPAIFTQIYVIHGLKNGKSLPLVYLLAPSKSKVMYTEFLKILHGRMTNYKPERIMIDFELAFIEAFKSVYSEVHISGCNFHFAKCIYRHVQTCGLQTRYNTDVKFSMNVRLLMALAFVPPVDVVAAYEEIVSSEYYEVHGDILESLLDYFELTWIGKAKHNKNKRQKPIFPIKMWNCYNAVMDDLNRSNNPCEGWNAGFNIRVGQPHPVMAGFIQSLKDEQNKTEILINQIQTGLDVVGGRLKAYQNYTERLKRIARDYDVDKKLQYLNNIAKVLASKSYI